MIAVEETRDVAALNAIARQPDLYDAVSQDGDPVAERADVGTLLAKPGTRAVAAKVDGVIVGFWIFARVTDRILEGHTVLTKAIRGAPAVEATRLALRLAFGNPDLDLVVTYAPKSNRPAKVFANACGFRTTGFLKDCWLKRGVREGVWLFGLDRPTFEKGMTSCRG